MYRLSPGRLSALLFWAALMSLTPVLARPVCAQSDQVIYSDSLQNGWQDWGWAPHSYSNSSPTHAGTASVSVTMDAWQGLFLHHSPFDTTPYNSLTFWVHGGQSGGQRLQVQALLSGRPQQAVWLPPLAANTWQQITIPLESLGVAGAYDMDGFWIQDRSGTAQPTFYVDDITLTAGAAAPVTNAPVKVQVDVAANRHPISPLVYGHNYAGSSASDLNCPLNRIGGNNMSRYNWRLNADNRGADWFFQSIAEDNPAPNGRIDSFVQDNLAAGSLSMVTIPTLGWTARVNPDRSKRWSFSVGKYGPQQQTDPWNPDSGNGVRPDGSLVTGNDPYEASMPADVAFMQGCVQHLVGKFGTAASGGVRYYVLDNEPSLWHGTHRDVFPTGASMDQVFTRMRDYGAMIKSVDPSALVVGPEEWGWSGYLYSGYDLQWGTRNGWGYLPDRAAHGGMDYVPWLLQQMKNEESARGRRLLDVLTLHYYPQGGEFWGDTSPAMQRLRNRSTRSLWDPNYTDESWINDRVQLIPRMKAWVAQHYPGTKIGLTEYNWGAENHINGATAQADILGILGREGVDLATRWTVPGPTTPTYKAFQMYRNYDGRKSTFGDVSVGCAVPDPDSLSAFAAQDSRTGAVTVMVISKVLSGDTSVTLNVANFTPAGSAGVYQLTAANVIRQLPDQPVSGGAVTLSVPSQSITLLVLPKAGDTPPAAPTDLTARAGAREVALSWTASPNAASYKIKRSTTSEGPFTTLAAPGTNRYTDTSVSKGATYFYVVTAVNAAGESGSSNEVSVIPYGRAGNDATFVSQSVPNVMRPGRIYEVSVTMQNTGTSTWTRENVYRLGSQSWRDNSIWGTGRVQLASPVPLGGLGTFTFRILAPSPGIYPFHWCMVQEYVEWFGEATRKVSVRCM